MAKKSATNVATNFTPSKEIHGKFPNRYGCPVVLVEVPPETPEGTILMALNHEGREYGPYRVAKTLNAGEGQLTTFAMCYKEPKPQFGGSAKVSSSTVADAQMKVLFAMAQKLGIEL